MTEDVSVVVPIGPRLEACRFLKTAIDSILEQTVRPSEIVFVDDCHDILSHRCTMGMPHAFLRRGIDFQIHRTPWRSGVAHAFNFGVSVAKNDCVIMLGADDTMEPTAIEQALKTYSVYDGDAYYFFGVRYMDTGEVQTVPCGEAMVTKGLWRATGGFPVESAVGAPDAALLSIMLVHMPEAIIPIADGKPLINYRRHADTDTASRGSWQGPIIEARNILTNEWKRPQWGRYEP